jgi:multiple sugar transport system substrate-binding protein
MRRRVCIAIGLLALPLLAAGWTDGGSGVRAGADTKKPVTITFWSAYSAPHELAALNAAFAAFHAKYPWITVKGTFNMNDDKILAAISSGTPPDSLLSFSPDNVGKFCSTGAWTNLNDDIKSSKLDMSIFPKAALSFSSFKGNQCSLPALADAYGLYYNKAMFKAKGIAHPPRTLSELAADAKKLTVRNSDGSIKVAGFVPLGKYYEDAISGGMVQAYGAHWFDSSGKADLSRDPRWTSLLTWQKSLIDWYGYDKLLRFSAVKGDEFSASNDFERGKVAMMYDGEWRTAFVASDKSTVDYGTAPFPAADSAPGQYGSGFTAGNLVAIPKGSKHPDEAWLFIRFLATDTKTMVNLSNQLRNVPTTAASAASPDIKPDAKFKPFLKIFTNPLSTFAPVTPIGQAYQDLFLIFLSKYEAGKVSNLASGLKGLDQQIDDQLSQQETP